MGVDVPEGEKLHVRLRNPVFGLRLAFEQAVPFETV
jgi:hypothetical protein